MNPAESLLVSIQPLGTEHNIHDVGEILLRPDYERFLCLPVVSDGRPVGVISRATMQGIYMTAFGRELHGKKSVAQFMNPNPLVVDIEHPMAQISHHVTRNIKFPITEDFIFVREGRYLGLGHVVDLLREMERELSRQHAETTQAYAQLKTSQAHLVQSEKMASLGQMVAGVAHEINTPLGYVKNNVSMAQDVFGQLLSMVSEYDGLLSELSPGETARKQVKDRLEAIGSLRDTFQETFQPEDLQNLFSDTLFGVEQISEIVRSLKDFSRMDQAAVDHININQNIENALLIAKNLIKHRAEVVRQFSDVPAVSCSPSQISQVFLNLISNAVQAMDKPGVLTLRTWHDDKFVYASVQDTGKGIPGDHLKKIFDPFFTTKAVGEGTGLGLSIVFKILQDHKGLLRVNSKPGEGSLFTVGLPRKNRHTLH